MEIYGDLYMLINGLCDFLALSLCSAILRRRAKKRRLLLGSAIGAIFALFSLFLPRPLVFALSFPAAFLMVFAVFSFVNLRRYLLSCLVFYLSCFFMSGVVTFFSSLIGEYLTASAAALTLTALLCLSCFLALFLERSVRRLSPVRTARLRFSYRGKDFACLALVDTGNLLFDAERELPVVLLSPDLFGGDRAAPPPCRFIEIHTVSSSQSLPLIDISAVAVDGKNVEASAALCDRTELFTQYSALLPAALIPQNTERKKGSLCLPFSKRS